VKIGLADVEIIGLTEISKSIIKKIKQQQNRSAGGLKMPPPTDKITAVTLLVG